MRRHVVVLVVLALVAAACGNRSRRRRQRRPGGGTDDSEVATGEATDVGDHRGRDPIGVIADISGVVPGLFGAAPEAVEAYAAMVNEDGGINGRDLVVEVFDTKTTDAGNAAAYEEACPKVFASVGSESAFDTGGLDAQRECGFPDLAGFKTDPDVQALANVFPRVDPDYTGVGAARWFAEEFPDAVSNAAIFHGTPQVTVRAAENLIEARESVGWVFSYRQPIAPLESNYTPHALEMQSRDIQAFAFVADVNNIVRLQKALGQLGYAVQVADVNTQGYTPDYLDAVGADGEGSYVPLAHALFEEADEIPALRRVHRVAREGLPRRGALVERPDRLGARQALRRSRRGRGRGPHPREAHGGARDHHRLGCRRADPARRHRRARSGDGVLRHGAGEGRRLRAGLPRERLPLLARRRLQVQGRRLT